MWLYYIILVIYITFCIQCNLSNQDGQVSTLICPDYTKFRFSLIIEDPQNIHFFTFWPINEKMVFKLFPLVVHNYVSTVMRSAFADILVPLVPLDFMYYKGPNMTPKKIKLN